MNLPRFLTQAQDDLTDELLAQRPRTGRRTADAIRAACDLVARFPLLGRERGDLKPGLRSRPVSGFVIFYYPLDDGAEIARVLNGRRLVTPDMIPDPTTP